jgi:hypothetical protein
LPKENLKLASLPKKQKESYQVSPPIERGLIIYMENETFAGAVAPSAVNSQLAKLSLARSLLSLQLVSMRKHNNFGIHPQSVCACERRRARSHINAAGTNIHSRPADKICVLHGGASANNAIIQKSLFSVHAQIAWFRTWEWN